jgi:hypothetical protein
MSPQMLSAAQSSVTKRKSTISQVGLVRRHANVNVTAPRSHFVRDSDRVVTKMLTRETPFNSRLVCDSSQSSQPPNKPQAVWQLSSHRKLRECAFEDSRNQEKRLRQSRVLCHRSVLTKRKYRGALYLVRWGNRTSVHKSEP